MGGPGARGSILQHSLVEWKSRCQSQHSALDAYRTGLKRGFAGVVPKDIKKNNGRSACGDSALAEAEDFGEAWARVRPELPCHLLLVNER